MKTPKRNKAPHARCEFCQSIISIHDEDNKNGWFACPFCGKESKITDEFVSSPVRARWKRKNREARLRRKIALLTKELERQKQIAKWQHQKDRERYEEIHKDWYELKRKYQELKKKKKGSRA